jgi:hypothetical protein
MLLKSRSSSVSRTRAWTLGLQLALAVCCTVDGLALAFVSEPSGALWCGAICGVACVWYICAERSFFEALRRRDVAMPYRRAAHEWCVLIGLALACAVFVVVLAVRAGLGSWPGGGS